MSDIEEIEFGSRNLRTEDKQALSQVPAQCDCLVPVTTLQAWALDLSQGDNSPRWEIEKLLTDAGHDIRDRSI